ncbi:MAG: sugar kinase [Marmoricola sp.]|nr:sugar kinase [Marmoricola sp.]
MALNLRPADECVYDAVSLGEVMLRFDPGNGRIRTARSFRVWEGGGEYNVARGLRRCFGQRTAIVSALTDNDLGRLAEDLILQGGVDPSRIQWMPFDGVGRASRVGLNFTERGFSVRGALGVSDRGLSAASLMKPGVVDWEHLFGTLGVRCFHTGGIFAALSAESANVIEEAIAAAHRHGTVVSYDLNYRPSLWSAIGGVSQAQQVNQRLVSQVDILIGNEEDFSAAMGFSSPDADPTSSTLNARAYQSVIESVTEAYPHLQVVATTLRGVHSASVNDWGAIAWSDETGFVRATHRPALEILDRVGGGDSFVAGLLYGLLNDEGLAVAVEYGAAHGALAMTTPGDTSMASLAEVKALVEGASARITR